MLHNQQVTSYISYILNTTLITDSTFFMKPSFIVIFWNATVAWIHYKLRFISLSHLYVFTSFSIIELLQSLDIPGLNETWVQDWLKQVQLMQYINDVIADLLASNNGNTYKNDNNSSHHSLSSSPSPLVFFFFLLFPLLPFVPPLLYYY